MHVSDTTNGWYNLKLNFSIVYSSSKLERNSKISQLMHAEEQIIERTQI